MNDSEYRNWLVALKTRYHAAQVKAAVAVNGALIEFYWSLGRDIEERFDENHYGAAFFERLSNDLCVEIPNVKGLSPINLRYANRFYRLYRNLPQLVEELMRVPWSSHRLIIDRSAGDADKAMFYVRRTIENSWSRSQLDLQLDGNLYETSGKAQTNFDAQLPVPDGRLARELIKSEYSFALTETIDEENERAIEKALVRNISRTLTELGGGFAYVGHQVRVNVGGKDFWPDLIFYHLKTQRYLVIELKAGEFMPEHVGQLGFYMTAVDRQIKNPWDRPTVGLVLCRKGNCTIIEYALNMTHMPMGVGKYELTRSAPPEIAEMNDSLSRLPPVVDATLSANQPSPENCIEKVIQSIRSRIEECRSTGDMFTMPVLSGCTISKHELPCLGAALSHCMFTVVLPDGRSVTIDYQSKDKSKTFSVVPDRSCIRIECSDHSNDFSDSWDEKC